MKKQTKALPSFDQEFIQTMISEQLESWASVVVSGGKIKVLVFDCQSTEQVIENFRREGWTVDFDHKPASPPPRIFYYFSHPAFQIY